MNPDATTYTKYTYLWDGTKLGAVDSDGNGLCYLGSLVYRRENTRHGGPVEGGSIQLKIPVFPRYIYSLESAGFEGGRIVALTTAQGTTYKSHYHVTDHLGSVRVVVDEDRNVLERSDYLPYGKRCSGGELSDNRYRYNGKEEQAFVENPYLDYGARMYDPDNRLSWTTPDPLAEKYYSISPYAFCAGNPINFIDPNGMDIWEIDQYGYIINRKEDKKRDAFYIVDEEGKRIEDQFIEFEYGTIKDVFETTVSAEQENETLTMFLVQGNDNATRLFEFMAGSENTGKVEWDDIKIGEPEQNQSIVGTMHKASKTGMVDYLFKNGVKFHEASHNHPRGKSESQADINVATKVRKKYPDTKFNIYVSKYGQTFYSPY